MKCFVVLSALVAVSQAGYIGTPYGLGLGYAGAGLGYAGAYGYASPIRAAIAPLPIRKTYAAVPAVTVAAAPVLAKAAPVAVAAAPAVVAKAAPAIAAPGVHATQYHAQDELKNYEFGYQNPNSARTEKGNAPVTAPAVVAKAAP